MLQFVGLGLWDERSITIKGREAIREADDVFAERYTSRLAGATIEGLERFHECEIRVLERTAVEQHPEPILEAARDRNVVFLVGGDPMVSTTHIDLRLRTAEADIDTYLIHGTSAASAAAGLTGLQNYRFGKATTIPFPDTFGGEGPPPSVIDTIEDNRKRGLHTLAFLDLDEAGERTLSGSEAASMLASQLGSALGVVVARAGSPEPLVRADRLETLAEMHFGGPLHFLVIPGELHLIEADALRAFADVPAELVTGD